MCSASNSTAGSFCFPKILAPGQANEIANITVLVIKRRVKLGGLTTFGNLHMFTSSDLNTYY